jgi:MFS family permease
MLSGPAVTEARPALAEGTRPLDPRIVEDLPYPSARRGWWLVSLFFLASVVATLDRGILALVVDPVRRDLAISEVQMSLLQGVAFASFYAVASIFCGLMADRVVRKYLLIGGIALWSLGTLGGGFVHDFAGMGVARLIVGFGEATLTPCAVSMISDAFPPGARGRPISVFLMGQAASGGLSILLTSFILGGAMRGRFDALGLARFAPWRDVFIVAGVVGFAAVALMLTMREPMRRGVVIEAGTGYGLREVARYLAMNAAVFLPFYLGVAICSIATYGAAAWTPTFLIRHFHLTPQSVGTLMGPVILPASLIGPLIGGVIVDKLSGGNSPVRKFTMLAVLPLTLLPAACVTFAPSAFAAVLLNASIAFFFAIFGTAFVTTAQELAPNNMRGVTVSLFNFNNTLIGQNLGPFMIAFGTERLFRDPARVGDSMFLVMTSSLCIASLCFVVAIPGIVRSFARGSPLSLVWRERGVRPAATVMDARSGGAAALPVPLGVSSLHRN